MTPNSIQGHIKVGPFLKHDNSLERTLLFEGFLDMLLFLKDNNVSIKNLKLWKQKMRQIQDCMTKLEDYLKLYFN